MHDDQLREQFTTWARPLQDTRPPALPVLRRRASRRTARRATVSGLAVIGVAAAIVLSGFPRIGHAPAAPAATPTARGVPPYAVVIEHSGLAATVLDIFTGKALGRVAPPIAGSSLAWVAAAADDRTFVLADNSPTLVTRFYRLHLAASGKPGRLTQLDVPPLHDSQIYGMALTADASRLAMAWQKIPTGPVAGHISVTTLATGATRSWTSLQGGGTTVAWAGDRTLAFYWEDNDHQSRSGLRLLDTAAADTNPLASRLILPASTRIGTLSDPGNPLITQDGSTVFVTLSSGATAANTSIVSFSARTGKLLAVLTPAVPIGQSPWYCGILWTDSHGRHLITQCATTQDSIEGTRLTPIHLSQLLPVSNIGPANTFAW